VRQWISRILRGQFARCVGGLPPSLDGRQLVRMTRPSLAALCSTTPSNGNAIFNALRDEIERVDKIMNKNRKEQMAIQQRQKEGW